ncbi:hypothetical protein THAOC_08598, partial [Thalassiosira oceanica]
PADLALFAHRGQHREDLIGRLKEVKGLRADAGWIISSPGASSASGLSWQTPDPMGLLLIADGRRRLPPGVGSALLLFSRPLREQALNPPSSLGSTRA